jgi:two-component system NtrC family sensor kinase
MAVEVPLSVEMAVDVADASGREEPVAAPVPDGRTADISRTRILVIEDDPMVRTMVDAVLRSYGYRCLLAENGPEALAIFEEHGSDISLALLDVIMPGMNGKQVCEALRARSPQLKVLFLTGYTADVIKNRGILVDGIDLLLKPAQSDVLANKIRAMLDS